MFRWWDRNDLHRIQAAQLQILRKVNYIMAAWAEVKAVIDELKARWAKVSEDLSAVHAKLDECLKKDALDAAELEVAKADLAKVVGEMNDHLHADGM